MWKKWERLRTMGVWEENSDDSSGGPGTSEEEEGSRETQESNSDPAHSGSEGPFAGTIFEGKTVAEVQEMFSVRDRAVREQGAEMTRMHGEIQRLSERREEPPRGQTPFEDEEITSEQFFANPDAALKKRDARLISEIKGMMDEQIRPFRDDLARSQAQGAWNEVSRKFSDFETYRPHIEVMVQRNNIQSPNSGTIESLYYMAKGMQAAGQLEVQGQNRDESNGNRGPHRMNPQHQPSSHPTKGSDEGKPKLRALTEAERSIARQSGWNPNNPEHVAEFLALQSAEEDEVLSIKGADNK